VVFGLERIEHLEKNWRKIAEEVLNSAKKIVDSKEVIVFGSVIKGKVTGASDLDLALVVKKDEVSKILLDIHSMLPEEISEIIDLIIIDEGSEEGFLKLAGECVIIK
jgi:Nucleotidyltransferase domain.